MTFLEQILLTIVTASATAILAYFGFWRQAKAELKKEYESRFNEKKWEVYSIYINSIPNLIRLNVLVNKRNEKVIKPEEQIELDGLAKIYRETEGKIEHQLLLIGSKEVVKSYLEWQERTSFIDVKSEIAVEVFVNLINAMREDLGTGKSNLSMEDLDGTYFFSHEKLMESRRIANQNIKQK